MKALILAAGYATRLYPLTKEYPKSLLLVGQRPIIDYIIDKLAVLDELDEIFVVTNSKFISKFKNWSKTQRIKKRLTIIDDLTKDENHKRGAIGDIGFAINDRKIKNDLLVIGGDNLFDKGLLDFVSFAKKKELHPTIGIFDIKDISKADKYGVVKLDDNRRIIDFKEKSKNPNSTLVAMCLYYFPKEKLSLIKEYLNAGTNSNDATGFYIDWLRKNESVFGFVFNGRWYDIGHRSFYNEAKEAFSKKEEL